MRKVIEKKVLPKYFNDILSYVKCFEIREDTDDVQVGDTVILREWDGMRYTGSTKEVKVTYVLRDIPDFGLKDGYCIFSW